MDVAGDLRLSCVRRGSDRTGAPSRRIASSLFAVTRSLRRSPNLNVMRACTGLALAAAGVLATVGSPLAAAQTSASVAAPQSTGASSTSSVPNGGTPTSTGASGADGGSVSALSALRCVSSDAVLARPLRWQAANTVVVGIPITAAARARALVTKEGIAGILVRGTPKKTDRRALIAIRDARPEVPTFVAVDEEGGRVQHLRTAVGVVPSARKMQATLTPQQVRALAKTHAIGMRALGFTMNFGPVADLYSPNPNGIGDRAFSEDPAVVAVYATAFAAGMNDGGIYPVLKHFPGHGRAGGDPHQQGTVGPNVADLREADIVPFQRTLLDTRAGVMVSHQAVPDLDNLPASVSNRATEGLLRRELRFNGLVMTDSLSMWSVAYHWGAPEAAVRAIRAGNDIVLFDDEPNVGAIITAIVDAAQKDPAFAARVVAANIRVLTAKGIPLCPGASLPTLPPAGRVPSSVAPASSAVSSVPPLANTPTTTKSPS